MWVLFSVGSVVAYVAGKETVKIAVASNSKEAAAPIGRKADTSSC